MANLTEQQIFDGAVYELSLTDPVMGGPGGVDNKPHQNLANRTAWLKQQVDALISAGGSAADIAAAINAHLAATDPHAQYTTDAEVNALIHMSAALPVDLLTNQDALRSARGGIIDMNAAIIGGVYSVPATVLNPPPFQNATLCYLRVMRDGDVATTFVKQIAYAYATDEIYTRTGLGGTGIADATWTTWTKIPNVVADFNVSIGFQGYEKLPSGIIHQWGMGPAIGVAGDHTIIFPVAFPYSLLHVQVSTWLDQPFSLASPSWLVRRQLGILGSTTQTILYRTTSDAGSAVYPLWSAIGY